jgi:hypothetical protein
MLSSALALLVVGFSGPAIHQDFSGKAGQSPFIVSGDGSGKIVVSDGILMLLSGEKNQTSTIAFGNIAKQPVHRVEASWDMTLTEGGEGYAFALLDTSLYGNQGAAPEVKKWEEPNLPGVFAVAFKVHNPKNEDWFDGRGNIYGRPEREISIHWNGFEITRKVAPEEFRGNGAHRVKVLVNDVAGGAEITVTIDKSVVYNKFFVALMQPFSCRPAFGARTTDVASTLTIDNVDVKFDLQKGVVEKPIEIKALDKQLNDIDHTSLVSPVSFPESTKGIGRVICTLTLDKTEKGLDPWDRCASIYLIDEKGEKFEIVRYITPYNRAYTWQVDVTDYLPLLTGKKKVELACTTYSQGWLVSVDFRFYKGRLAQVPYKVEKVWSGWVAIGLKDKPESLFFTPKSLSLDKGLSSAKLRFIVTGHGMSPNSDNAAEFLPIKRTAWVNGASFENNLWKEDNYLNACRPQGGTWKFDRSGWGPGDVVRPWDIDISRVIKKGALNTFRYANAAWENKTPNQGFLAQHWVEAQVISYKK